MWDLISYGFLTPPAVLIVLCLLGGLLALVWRGFGIAVVLGGDVHFGDGATVPDSLGPLSLERVVYAAQAYRRLHLPVAVSGGPVLGSDATVGGLMQAALERDFAV